VQEPAFGVIKLWIRIVRNTETEVGIRRIKGYKNNKESQKYT
jgi:hypothetical protein